MIIRLLTFLFCLITMISNAQPQGLLPILSTPNVMLDSKGELVFSLPKDEYIINDWDGQHDYGWVQGMANIDIGLCGNIVAFNTETRKHSMYDTNGKLVQKFYKNYKSFTPCNEGFHIACYSQKKSSYYSVDRYQFIDIDGNVSFALDGYMKADIFVDGLAAVQTISGNYAYMNDLGHELDIIPDTIDKISNVTSFHSGISVIKCSNKRIGNKTTYKIYLLNKEGEIIFSSDHAFNGKPVTRVSRFYDGILTIEMYKENAMKEGSHLVFVNTSGDVIFENENQFSYKESKAGYILSRTKTGEHSYNKHNIYDIEGKEILIPRKFEDESARMHQINDQYFQISYSSEEGGKRRTIFDASIGKDIYNLDDNVMAVKNDLISLVNKSTKRYYVVNKNTKEVVYDTKLENQVVKDLEKVANHSDQVRTFVCTKSEDLNKIGQLTGLHELTIRLKDMEELPDLRELTNLKILRLDGCRSLKKFPTYLNSLKQLSLRDCTSATNVIEMVDAQLNLEKLFLINFDIKEEDKRRLLIKYPDGEISGTSKNADSMIQMEVYGF